MKKSIFITFYAFCMLFMSCEKENVIPENNISEVRHIPPNNYNLTVNQLYAEYLTENDSTTNVVGNVSTFNHIGCNIYSFVSQDYNCAISFTFKDINGGYITPTDTLYVVNAQYTINNNTHYLRNHNIPRIYFPTGCDYIIIEYEDCVLPLNGTSGKIRVKFKQ